jgi:Sulfotransferase domain
MDWAADRIWPCSWQEHVNSWLAPRLQAAPFELTVLRYEDFAADPVAQTGILAEVFGVDVGRARIEEIVTDTSSDSMRERESKEKTELALSSISLSPPKRGIGSSFNPGMTVTLYPSLKNLRMTQCNAGYSRSAEGTGHRRSSLEALMRFAGVCQTGVLEQSRELSGFR